MEVTKLIVDDQMKTLSIGIEGFVIGASIDDKDYGLHIGAYRYNDQAPVTFDAGLTLMGPFLKWDKTYLIRGLPVILGDFLWTDIKRGHEKTKSMIADSISMGQVPLEQLRWLHLFKVKIPEGTRYYDSMKAVPSENILMNLTNLEHISMNNLYDMITVDRLGGAELVDKVPINYVQRMKLVNKIIGGLV